MPTRPRRLRVVVTETDPLDPSRIPGCSAREHFTEANGKALGEIVELELWEHPQPRRRAKPGGTRSRPQTQPHSKAKPTHWRDVRSLAANDDTHR